MEASESQVVTEASDFSSNFSFSESPSISSPSPSLAQLADKYRQGVGVKQNYQEAVRLYQLAAQGGDAGAEAWIAYFNLMGWGGLKSDPEAFRLSKIGVQKK